MLRKKSEVRIEQRDDIFGGPNSIFGHMLLELPELKGAGRVFQKIVIPPHSGLGYHVHKGDSEAYYILEGSGIYNDNGTETELHAGDMSFTPDGCGHSFYNNTEKNVSLIAVVLYNFEKDKDLSGLRKIRRAGSYTRKDLHAPFDGRGDFYGQLIMEGDEFTGAARVMNIMHMLPDCKLGYHEHNGETEVFYCISGKGIFTDDDKVIEIGPGDVMITPTGHGHALENKSDEELVYAAIIYYDKV